MALACLGAAPAWASGGGGGHPAAEKNKTADADGVSEPAADGSRTVRLGEFSIRVFHGTASRKDTVSFVLYTIVKKDDFDAFDRIYSHHKTKVRDQVIVATRLVPIDDYDDPELKKFRRRIFLRIRRALPELPIEDVYFSDFSLMSQAT